jgi:hypothetical protein
VAKDDQQAAILGHIEQIFGDSYLKAQRRRRRFGGRESSDPER